MQLIQYLFRQKDTYIIIFNPYNNKPGKSLSKVHYTNNSIRQNKITRFKTLTLYIESRF